MCRCPCFVEFPSVIRSQWVLQSVTLATPTVVQVGLAKVFVWKKSCPACHGYPTCRGEITRPPELSRVPRQLGVIQLNGCINFIATQGKVNSPRVTRGRVVSGTRDHINGTLESHPVCFLCILIGQFPLRDMPAGNHGSFINWNKYPVQDDE